MEKINVAKSFYGSFVPLCLLFLTILIALPEQTSAQPFTVTGKVIDAKAVTPIPGVSIVVKGTSSGTATNKEGYFSLKVPNANSILTFSFVGFRSQDVSVNGKKSVEVMLQPEEQSIDEVIVIGYGSKKKVNLTGAVASVETKMLESRPQRNLLNSIQGAIPGVTITTALGGSDGTSINIRGRGNLGTSSPLYIVDGIEVSSAFFTDLDPTSIETISFLKDASSAAIYGAKAAYGVVLVTTKKGREGTLRISYNGSYGLQQPNILPRVVNSGDYAEMYSIAEGNSGIAPANRIFNPEMIAKYRSGENPDLYPNTNWFDLLLRKRALFTKHNLLFEGGSRKISYLLTMGYLSDESINKGVGNQRYNFTSKTTAELKPWFNITSSINLIYNRYDRSSGSTSFVEALRVPPTMVAKHSNGNYGSIKNGRLATANETLMNPLRTLEQGGRGTTDTKRLLGTISAEFKIMEGVKFTNQVAYIYNGINSTTFQNKMSGIPNFLYPDSGIIPGSSRDINQMDVKWKYTEKYSYDGWLNINKTLGEFHNFEMVAGYHADKQAIKNIDVGRKNFAVNSLGSIDGGSTDPADQIDTKGGVLEEGVNSYFGRLSYTLKQRYLFEVNFRADASSRFASRGRWGYFPSLSAGWRIEQEEFMKNIRWISGLKLRSSWGKNGNIYNVGEYDTYSTFSAGSTAVIGGVVEPLVTEKRVGNPYLTWETTTSGNIGIDLDIKNGLVNFTGEYYNRTTKGILIRSNDLATEVGLTKDQVPARNVGIVQNRGFEFAVSHRLQLGDLSYSIGGNLTLNRNKIVDLGNKVTQLPPDNFWIMRKGASIGDFYMLEAIGIYSTDEIASNKGIPYVSQKPEAGMIKFKDQNGDGVINDADRIITGNSVPNITYGLNFEVKYKNFSLSVLGQGVSKVKVYLDNEASQAFFDFSVPREWQKDSWTPQNQNAVYPKLFLPTDERYKYNNRKNSFWLFDASYFRIKNITLSYELPKSLLSKLSIHRASVFISGDNLITLRGDRRMKDFDPERISGRSAYLNYQNFTTGINVSF